MKLAFCGCSYTVGIGVLTNECFADITAKTMQCNYKNFAHGGAGNREIFLQAVDALISDADVVIVQWSAAGRQYFKPQYNKSLYSKNKKLSIHFVNQQHWNNFVDTFITIDNYYNQYCELNQQITRLDTLAQQLDKKIYYMNGIMYIDPVFLNSVKCDFAHLNNKVKNILFFENLPDEELTSALDDIRNQLTCINPDHWINIQEMEMLDLGSDNDHPGVKSHRHQAQKIVNFIKGKK